MAMIYSGIRCALCCQVIDDDLLDKQEFVATTHFIDDRGHPLWPFSDAAMHRTCFMSWDRRAELVQAYNDVMGAFTWRNGTYHFMKEDGNVISLKRGGNDDEP